MTIRDDLLKAVERVLNLPCRCYSESEATECRDSKQALRAAAERFKAEGDSEVRLRGQTARAKTALSKAGIALNAQRQTLRSMTPGNVAHHREEARALSDVISDALIELNRVYYEEFPAPPTKENPNAD